MKSRRDLAQKLASLSRHAAGEPAEDFYEEAEEIAAFLGVELAPERPALPGWAEEELALTEPVDVMTKGGGWLGRLSSRETAAAVVEIHRRWLAAKRLLERAEERAPGCFWKGGFLRSALQALRGEDEP